MATGRWAIFSKRSLSAWLLRATKSTCCSGWLWYSVVITCTATSVFPVPGGPSITVSPSCRPDRIASTCVGVKRTGGAETTGVSEKGRYSSWCVDAYGVHTTSSSAKWRRYGGNASSAFTATPLLFWKRTSASGKDSCTCLASTKVSPKSTVRLCGIAE